MKINKIYVVNRSKSLNECKIRNGFKDIGITKEIIFSDNCINCTTSKWKVKSNDLYIIFDIIELTKGTTSLINQIRIYPSCCLDEGVNPFNIVIHELFHRLNLSDFHCPDEECVSSFYGGRKDLFFCESCKNKFKEALKLINGESQ